MAGRPNLTPKVGPKAGPNLCSYEFSFNINM
jgi:hypothetical protein